jgi:hypothetical protein
MLLWNWRWMFLLLGASELSAQRCGYDYIHAFVIKVVTDSDTQNIKRLQLTVVGENGTPLKEFQKYADEYGTLTGQSKVKNLFESDVPENLYVLFYDVRRYNPNNKGDFWIRVEHPKGSKYWPKDSVRFFKINIVRSNFLCGHYGPYEIVTLNLTDSMNALRKLPLRLITRGVGNHPFSGRPRMTPIITPPKPIIPQHPVSQNPQLMMRSKPAQWIEMKGSDFIFRDSFRIYNKGAERLELPEIFWVKSSYNRLVQINAIHAPAALLAGDSDWVRIELGVAKEYRGNVYGLPFEEQLVPLSFKFKGGFEVSASVHYWVVDANFIVTSTPHYECTPTPQGWFWVIEKERNYGRCMRQADTVFKIGTWHIGHNHTDTTYSRNFQFSILLGDKVVNNATIYAIKNGEKRKIHHDISGEFYLVWLVPGIDTLRFEWEGNYNEIMLFNRELHQSMFMIELMDAQHSSKLIRQYPEFRTYECYQMLDTLFLLKLSRGSDKKLANILGAMRQYVSVSHQDRYDKDYVEVRLPKGKEQGGKKLFKEWIEKGWIESAHQGVLLHKRYGGLTFFSGELVVKPLTQEWWPQYDQKAHDFKLNRYHSMGDGTVLLRDMDGILDEKALLRWLEFGEDSRWKYCNPSFINPRIRVDDFHKMMKD